MSTGGDKEHNLHHLTSMGTQTVNSILLNQKSFQFDIVPSESKQNSPNFSKARETEKSKKTISDYEEVQAFQSESDRARALIFQEQIFQQLFDDLSEIEDDDPVNPLLNKADYWEI